MNFLNLLQGLVGIIVLIAIAALFSSDKKKIDFKLILVGVLMQFVFAFFVLKTSFGRWLFQSISAGIVTLLGFTRQGAEFVFGPLASTTSDKSLGFIFAFQALTTIIFFASLMAVLYHLGIMQWIVKGFAKVIIWLMKVSGAEALSVSANSFVGQTEAPLVIRPYLEKMTKSEIFTLMLSGMAHISGGVMGAYIVILGTSYAKARGMAIDQSQIFFANHFLNACIIAAPATFVIAKVLIPETEEPATRGSIKLKIEKTYANVIEAAASGASDGVKLAINVAAMLIAFIALIALANYLLGALGGVIGLNVYCISHFGKPLSLELLFGLIFQFFAALIGVPWKDALNVGSLIGVKLVLNEFVAYSNMANIITQLSDRAVVIAIYALCGFANFSSIAIQIGGISPLAENQRSRIAQLGLRAVFGGTIATLMTAAIAGIMY